MQSSTKILRCQRSTADGHGGALGKAPFQANIDTWQGFLTASEIGGDSGQHVPRFASLLLLPAPGGALGRIVADMATDSTSTPLLDLGTAPAPGVTETAGQRARHTLLNASARAAEQGVVAPAVGSAAGRSAAAARGRARLQRAVRRVIDMNRVRSSFDVRCL